LADGSGYNAENPTLSESATAALNVLNRNPNGFVLMIEGGAVDWSNHSNNLNYAVGEMIDFNDAVQTVINWVEDPANGSSWSNTLLIVTGDHETGYLTAGPGVFPDQPLGTVNDTTIALEKIDNNTGFRASWDDWHNSGYIDPDETVNWSWNYSSHTNSLIPFYVKGAGAGLFAAYAVNNDPVRGYYIDNTNVFNVMNSVLSDFGAPESVITEPVHGAILSSASSNPYTISGTATDNVAVQSIEVSTNGGGTWNAAICSGCPGEDITWTYSWSLPADGSYTIRSRATDTSSNVETPGTGNTITVDRTAPLVNTTVPTNGATDVAVNSTVTINWNEAVDCTTVNTTNITSSSPGWSLSSCSGNQAVFMTSGQAVTTSYNVTVTTGVKDAAGNQMAASYPFSYTTGSTQALVVTAFTATSPSNSLNIPITSFTAADSCPAQSNVSVIAKRDTWKYNSDNFGNIGTTWKDTAYDDSGWSSGSGIFGFGETYINTIVGATGQWSEYFRKTFTICDAGAITALRLNATYDDGMSVYINGVQVVNAGVTGNPPAWNGGAAAHESNQTYEAFNLDAYIGSLVSGVNVIAVGAYNNNSTSSDLVFDGEVVISSTGGGGVTGYKITTTATPPLPGDAGWTSTAPATYTVGSDGTYTLYPWVKNASGSVSAVFATPRTVVADATAPTSGSAFTAIPGDTQCSLSWDAATDSGSGLHTTQAYEIRYQAGSDPGSCTGGSSLGPWGTATLSYPHTNIQNGTTYYYRLCYKDNVNNQSQFTGNPKTCTPSGSVCTLPDAVDNTSLSISGNWACDQTTSHDGVDSAKSAAITHNQTTSMSTTVVLAVSNTLTFWWKVSSEANYDYLRFYIDGVEQSGRISGEVNWQQKTFNIPSGSHTLEWRYTKDGSVNAGSDRGWVDQVVLAAPCTLPEAVDNTSLSITTGGSGNWACDQTTSHDGVDSAKSGVITHNQTTSMSTTVVFAVSNTLTFWWKVSSEANYDYLRFYIDGVEQAGSISGEINWQQKTFNIPSGSHTLEWRYTKDVSVNSGSDRGWVDQVDQVAVDTIAPEVSATLPADKAEDVALNSDVTITFSEDVDCTTVTTSTITSSSPGWSLSSCSGSQAVFNTGGQAGLTTYTVTVTTGVKDIAGNQLSAALQFIYTTIDNTAPIVTAFTVPATSTSLTIPINSFTATDNAVVTGYMITTTATPPLAGDAAWTETAPATYTAGSDGVQTLYPWAKDAVGNVSAVFATPRTVTITMRKWTGGGADNLASNPANWLNSLVPQNGDSVLFNGTSAKNCDWNISVTVGSLNLNSGYTGVFTLNTNLSITDSLIISDGTFITDAGNLTVGQ
jgi:hypothetical protein